MNIFPKDIQFIIRNIWFKESMRDLLESTVELKACLNLYDMTQYQILNDVKDNITFWIYIPYLE